MENKRVGFVSTFGDFLVAFELDNIHIYQNLGYEVFAFCNFSEKKYNRNTQTLINLGVTVVNVSFKRKPSLSILKQIKELAVLFRDNHISVVDCHNAVCGVIARLAAKKCKINKVVYSPHGFFFYDGCPLKNKMIFRTVEKKLAKSTDVLVCINNEDFTATKHWKIRGESVFVPGVGVDVKKIQGMPDKTCEYRQEFGIEDDELFVVTVAEMIPRKNHKLVLEALSRLKKIKVKYVIVGLGILKEKLEKESKDLGIEDSVIFTGFRSDAIQISKACDLFVLPSFQEGLPVALMEAMSSGKPCIVSAIRGNVDLIKDKSLQFDPNSVDSFLDAFEQIYPEDRRAKESRNNLHIIEKYNIENVNKIMTEVYTSLLMK